MKKLFDKIVEITDGKITYHLIVYFLMVILIIIAAIVFL